MSADVTNTGNRAGTEVVQMYIRDVVSSVTRPVKELKGFQQVVLEPGETHTVTFEITPESLAFYDVNMKYDGRARRLRNHGRQLVARCRLAETHPGGPMSEPSVQKLSFAEKAGYSLGDGAANFVFQTMILFQLNFYTDTMGIVAGRPVRCCWWDGCGTRSSTP